MKLKSVLIIFLILGFFMAVVTAVRPAAAFEATVSIISEFDVETKTMRSTTDGTEGPLRGDPNCHYFDNKAVLSTVNDDVRVDVSGYDRIMQHGDVEIEYLDGGEVKTDSAGKRYVSETMGLYNNVARGLSDLSSSGCDVHISPISQMDSVKWIKITVNNPEGTAPVFTWFKYVQADPPMPAATITPDLASAAYPVVFSKSLYFTVKADPNTPPIYSWMLDSYGNQITESGKLSDSVALSVDTAMMTDANFVIRYTDARSFGNTGEDNKYWDGNYNEIEIKHAEYVGSLPGSLNPLTQYDLANNDYSILVPVYENMETTTFIPQLAKTKVKVYYDGTLLDTNSPIDGGKPLYDPNNTNYTYSTNNWITVPIDANSIIPSKDRAENWSFSNSKVVIIFDDTSDSSSSYHRTRVVGVNDGVGPILTNAYVSHDNNNILKLKFSEELADTIVFADAIANLELFYTESLDTIELNPQDAKELILTADREITPGQKVNLQLDDGVMSLTDTDFNPASVLNDFITVTEERIIEEVAVTGVDVLADTTTIEIKFDESMMNKATVALSDASMEAFYRVQLVPGLTKDTVNDGFAKINSADLKADEVTVTITVAGAIKSTAAADLPEISIVQDGSGNDMEGSGSAPVRASDKLARVPDDKVGPYLKDALFSYNPVMGKTVDDLIEDEALTLSLFFSEKVENSAAIGFHTFTATGWTIDCLTQAANDLGSQVDPNGWRVVLTLNELFAKNTSHLPFQSPAFTGTPQINIQNEDKNYILDAANNPASDIAAVTIVDDTKLWATEAKTFDDDTDGIVDKITVTFGKKINIYAPKFQKIKKIIKINNDPNIVANVTDSIDTITITLDETGRSQNTAWTPKVLFDLNDNTSIPIQSAANTDKDIKNDFELDSIDGVAPILNFVKGKLEAVADGNNTNETKFYVKVKLEFSEAMDPNIWAVPTDVWRYVSAGGNDESGVNPKTFITDDSTPSSTTVIGSGGNKIALYVHLNTALTDLNKIASIDINYDTNADQYENFDDLAGNAYKGATNKELTSVDPTVLWVPDSTLGVTATPSMNAMKIFGKVYGDDPNDTLITSANVYAFSQERLFEITDASADDGVENDPNRGCFYIDPNNAYGGAAITSDSFHIMVYGEESISGSASPGFKYGEPVILVVEIDNGNGARDPNDFHIATTACLSNTNYSIAFDGGPTKYPVEHDIYLSEREEINLRTGWNLISTSISGSYVDSALLASRGLDQANYSNYIHGPDDLLITGEGSLPTVEEVYELDNISSVLFTLSNKFFTGNIFYDPATNPIFPVEDQLADNFNKTPVFCTGRGYYVYIKDVPTPAGIANHEWKIVLFGKKVPGPEYKLRVDNTYDLIGHWGNLAYRTYDGSTMLGSIRKLLPSTHDTAANVEIVEDIADSGAVEDVVFKVCDEDKVAVGMDVVSTFWNYTSTYNYPASWYSAMPEFSNLFLAVPGVGYWILLDAEAADGPFFVSYAPKDK